MSSDLWRSGYTCFNWFKCLNFGTKSTKNYWTMVQKVNWTANITCVYIYVYTYSWFLSVYMSRILVPTFPRRKYSLPNDGILKAVLILFWGISYHVYQKYSWLWYTKGSFSGKRFGYFQLPVPCSKPVQQDRNAFCWKNLVSEYMGVLHVKRT